MANYTVIVPAAGVGTRMGVSTPKQYLSIKGKTILEHTLKPLLAYACFTKIVLILDVDDLHWSSLGFEHPKLQVCKVGGAQRCHSVYNGLLTLKSQAHDWILVHDAVRPCLKQDDLDRLILQLSDHPIGGLLGIPIYNSLKRVDTTGKVVKTLENQKFWQALTPQMFRYNVLCKAIHHALNKQQFIPDEASAVEYLGFSPQMVQGCANNIKLTTQEDLPQIAQYLSLLAG